MKLLFENWREYTKNSSPQWINTIWLSGTPTPRLQQAIEENYKNSQIYLRSCQRELDSCDANTDFWVEILANLDFDVVAIRDGVYNDGDTPIGHDWIIVVEDGREIIFDAAAEQFDTEPWKDKYTRRLNK